MRDEAGEGGEEDGARAVEVRVSEEEMVEKHQGGAGRLDAAEKVDVAPVVVDEVAAGEHHAHGPGLVVSDSQAGLARCVQVIVDEADGDERVDVLGAVQDDGALALARAVLLADCPRNELALDLCEQAKGVDRPEPAEEQGVEPRLAGARLELQRDQSAGMVHVEQDLP